MIPRRRYSWPPAIGSLVESAITHNSVCEGSDIKRFENAFRKYLLDRNPGISAGDNVQVRATNSGRNALAILLRVLEIPVGSTVMVPAYTLGAIETFLRELGYGVVTCDVAEDTPVITPLSVSAAWTPEVSCVLATHLFGYLADIPAIEEIARARNAVVIEDCAHTPGSYLSGRHVGLMAQGSIFSLDSLKPVNTFGGGFAVVTSRASANRLSNLELPPSKSRCEIISKLLAAILEDFILRSPLNVLPTLLLASPFTGSIMRDLDNRLRRPSRSHYPVRSLSNLQSTVGLKQLASVDSYVEQKRNIAKCILAASGKSSAFMLDESKRCNAYFLVLKVTDPNKLERLRMSLWRRGIDAGIGGEVADYIACSGERPNARRWAGSCIQIPCFPGMTESHIAKLGEVLSEFSAELLG